jgi:hypothetical protein
VIGYIAENILDSLLFGMSTGRALKMSLWRAKQKRNSQIPTPPLSKGYSGLMKTEIPDKLSKTTNTEKVSILVLMSNTGADIMKRATAWVMERTFKRSRAISLCWVG